MITETSLQHPRLRVRLLNAMKTAGRESLHKGIGFAHVGGIDVVHLRRLIGGGFRFFDTRDQDITSSILTALRGLQS